MKFYILLLLLLCTTLLTNAQTKANPVPDKGKEKSLSQHTDKEQGKVTEVRLYNGSDIRAIIHWTKGADGKYTYKKDCYIRGWLTTTITFKFDENKKILSKKTTTYEEYPKVQFEYESKRQPDGSLKGGQPYDQAFPPEEVKELEKEYQKEIEEIEKNNPDPVSFNIVPCNPSTGNCSYKAEAFIGYSYLSGKFGADNKSFPVGIHASALYNLNPHIATGINASFHSRKEGNETLTRSFIMIEGRYAFQDTRDCNRNFIADVHVLAGIGSEKLKYSAGGNTSTSKGSGPAFGVGLSGAIWIKTKIGFKAEADYIGVKFRNSDDLNNNFRATAGVLLMLGK